MKKFVLLLMMGITTLAMAQKTFELSGTVYNALEKSDLLVGANVLYETNKGAVTDIDGKFSIKLEPGIYNITFSYVGFERQIKKIEIKDKNVTLHIALEPNITIDEIRVVADVARTRETPVAFSTLTPKTLQENLASRDIPMVLNMTPGVYATQEGGGDGDASVTIRGFSARNVGVLLDGVPVNDMENGQVYWSNWFGLDAVTRSIQVQRGLGASKLALPSVGGTINIITRGMDSKRDGKLKQEIGSDGFTRTSFGYSSGRLKNDWAISVAGSYKQSDGYVDQLWSKGYFYYFKLDKTIGNHTLSASAYGAPQSHGQRSFMLPIAVYDSAYAEKVGVKLSHKPNMTTKEINEVDSNRINANEGIGLGLRYNQHWGYLARTRDNQNATPEPINERTNIYHKPQITLKDFWNINSNLNISNIAYLSIGNGGGVRSKNTIDKSEQNGTMNFQKVYNGNMGPDAIFTNYDSSMYNASNYLRMLVNEHFWYGLVSTINYKASKTWNHSGGVDLRNYKGTHYEKVYDLLGGDYAEAPAGWSNNAIIDYTKTNYFKDYMLFKNDKNNYHTDGLVRWSGLFYQSEFKKDRITAFINLTGALSQYKQINYMYGLNPDVKTKETAWENYPGFTAKTGMNYNLNEHLNGFLNVGYLSKAPQFNNVFDYNSKKYAVINNEKVSAVEMGYGYTSELFTANLNLYYTIWRNKPSESNSSIKETSDKTLSVKINTMDALHKGIEFDFIYKITDKIDFQGLMSLGDWRWNKADTFRVYNDAGNEILARFFDAKNVHVGNSAQTQFGGELRYEPIKGLYIKARATYFAKYYAEFDPISLDGKPNAYEWYNSPTDHGNARDSWRVPSYTLIDLNMGYRHKINGKEVWTCRLNVFNLLDSKYISKATNNDSFNGQKFNDFDAKSASVFMGIGRTYNLSLEVDF